MDFLSYNFLSDFFLLALRWIYSLIQDYSIAIILLTILMRAVLLPLDLKQRKNTAKMATLQPELESMKKRYANNPQQLQKKQQEMYREAGVKPLAGCLPMIVQLLIFFAFFGAMRVMATEQTVALFSNAAHAGAQSAQLPSWLWVHNFWQPDSGFEPVLQNAGQFSGFLISNVKSLTPQTLGILQHQGLIQFGADGVFQIHSANYDKLVADMLNANNLTGVMNGWFILPLIAGGSLFLQQKLTQASGQMPQQQQTKFMLWFFPIFSVWICATSNTAFAVYWLASNVYAIGQQLIINRFIKVKAKKPLVIKEGSKT